ncbi:MAG TPA: hypothetical protein PLQ36_02950, partial [Candidatus Gracilibacteria bacterium]|nr:hypothetical protein [Candidatus Gracilibacteria bacterium]
AYKYLVEGGDIRPTAFYRGDLNLDVSVMDKTNPTSHGPVNLTYARLTSKGTLPTLAVTGGPLSGNTITGQKNAPVNIKETYTRSGVYQIAMSGRDEAGNEQLAQTLSFKIDKINPSVTWTETGSAITLTSPRDLTFKAQDWTGIDTPNPAQATGIAKLEYSYHRENYNGTWMAWVDTARGDSLIKPQSDRFGLTSVHNYILNQATLSDFATGTYIWELRATDGVGNEFTKTFTITLDFPFEVRAVGGKAAAHYQVIGPIGRGTTCKWGDSDWGECVYPRDLNIAPDRLPVLAPRQFQMQDRYGNIFENDQEINAEMIDLSFGGEEIAPGSQMSEMVEYNDYYYFLTWTENAENNTAQLWKTNLESAPTAVGGPIDWGWQDIVSGDPLVPPHSLVARGNGVYFVLKDRLYKSTDGFNVVKARIGQQEIPVKSPLFLQDGEYYFVTKGNNVTKLAKLDGGGGLEFSGNIPNIQDHSELISYQGNFYVQEKGAAAGLYKLSGFGTTVTAFNVSENYSAVFSNKTLRDAVVLTEGNSSALFFRLVDGNGLASVYRYAEVNSNSSFDSVSINNPQSFSAFPSPQAATSLYAKMANDSIQKIKFDGTLTSVGTAQKMQADQTAVLRQSGLNIYKGSTALLSNFTLKGEILYPNQNYWLPGYDQTGNYHNIRLFKSKAAGPISEKHLA